MEKLAAPTKTVGGVLLPESATAGKVSERFELNAIEAKKNKPRRRRARCLSPSRFPRPRQPNQRTTTTTTNNNNKNS